MKTLLLLAGLLSCTLLFGQRIHGTVTDEKGNPLPFATLLVKGTTTGVTANSEGNYSIPLAQGNYTLECRYVGYSTVEKKVQLQGRDAEINFSLHIQQLELQEVVITRNGEDPAYAIIRKAIKKRPFYESQVSAFTANVYIKDMIKLLKLPERVLGKKIDKEDRKEMMLDSAGQGIVYLAESFTKVSVDKPDKLKMEVVSSRVSGSNGFGFDFPIFIDFNKNNVNVSDNILNKRGFVSPIADNALNFYNYKYLGSFVDNGRKVNTIKITPKRKYEPVFSGIINITDGDWRIFSCDLLLTKEAQVQLIDTLEISQIHTPVVDDVWRVKNQVIRFRVNQLGVAVGGSFVNIYSDYQINPEFSKKYFNNIVIKYDTAANKRTASYWDTLRPIPLEKSEASDFHIKDSVRIIRDSIRRNSDSLNRLNRPISFKNIVLNRINKNIRLKNGTVNLQADGLINVLQYNTVEGVNLNPSLVFSRSLPSWNKRVQLITDVRYGFSNRHLNPWAGIVVSNRRNSSAEGNFNNYSFYAAGGKRVSQFNKLLPLPELVNTVATLFYGWNDLKLYEDYFFKTGYKRRWENGTNLTLEGLYEDRLPLSNSTDYIFNKKFTHRLTPNYPVEILSSQFTPHKAVVLHAAFSFQPGQRYIQFPRSRISLGSKYPTFTIHYYKGIPDIFGSDENFDRWETNIRDEVNLRLAGSLKYYINLGGFINSQKVFIQDFKHFTGNTSHVASEYVRSFQNIPYYQFSNTSPFFAELHLEHHAEGLITNKLPLLRKWNWHLVEGSNALYLSPGTGYMEVFAGLENIFKIFRVDAVMSLQNGYKPLFTYRIGFGGLMGDALSVQAFKLKQKIITAW